ncbi:MAG: gamma-glutamyl kinase [Roseinatronobacter sp.]|nr:gamma-glutamyl kinase [Roseinatronobacter sp.]
MLYFHKRGLVFLATPKAGSSAIEKALSAQADIVFQGDPNLKHCTFQRYKWRVEKAILMFTDTPPQTMALIRQPEDWLGSWFRFRHGAWLNGTARSTRGLSFDQFVEGYLANPQPAFAAVGRQGRFLINPATDTTVDRLFQYEAMPAVTAWLSARLGQPVALGLHNVSPDWPITLSAELRRRLEQQLAEDYALHARA